MCLLIDQCIHVYTYFMDFSREVTRAAHEGGRRANRRPPPAESRAPATGAVKIVEYIVYSIVWYGMVWYCIVLYCII